MKASMFETALRLHQRQQPTALGGVGLRRSTSQAAVRETLSRWDSCAALSSLAGQIGGDGETSEDKEAEAEAEQERLEALREAEERRKEKHRRMEEEREKMRQQIRDKYGIKKKEEEKPAEVDDFAAGSLNRRKKTPEEIAAENEAAEQDDLTRLRNTIETQVNELKSSIEGKCVLQ
ncbi:hypothetical protein V5799_023537 [Amblyomma americanum]|uniref:Complexin n=1 Tax=Amblyomma americanum TaxID=6943 RepID=A0AAQ4FI54_AMBAM